MAYTHANPVHLGQSNTAPAILFGIYALTNKFNNFKYVNYFDGPAATDNKTTNTSPVLNLGPFNVSAGSTVNKILIDNATDPDNDTLTFYLDNSTTRGSLTLNDNATGNFTYTAPTFLGPDNFTYWVIDNYSARQILG